MFLLNINVYGFFEILSSNNSDCKCYIYCAPLSTFDLDDNTNNRNTINLLCVMKIS